MKNLLKKIYKQKFRKEWKIQFGHWCTSTENGTDCNVCDKKVSGGFPHVQQHSITELHQRNLRKKQNNVKITPLLYTEDQLK